MSVQTSTQSIVPAGAYWNFTLATPRFDDAVAASATLPVSGVPTAFSETATVLKSAAAVIVVGDDDCAVKSAPEDAIPAVAAASTASTARTARVMPFPLRHGAAPRRRAGATGGRG